MGSVTLTFGMKNPQSKQVAMKTTSWNAILRMLPEEFERESISRRSNKCRLRSKTRKYAPVYLTSSDIRYWFDVNRGIPAGDPTRWMHRAGMAGRLRDFMFLPEENPSEIFHDFLRLLGVLQYNAPNAQVCIEDTP